MTLTDILLNRIEVAYAARDCDELRRIAIAGVTDLDDARQQWDALERATT